MGQEVSLEERAALAAGVRELLTDRASEAALRETIDSEHGLDRSLWQRLAGLGALGLAVPEELGGGGASLVETGLVLEEAGRALLCAPLLSTVAVAEAVLASGDEAAGKEHLPGLVAGEVLGAVAVDPTGADADLQWDGRTLTGHVGAVLDGAAADLFLVPVAGAVVLVPRSAAVETMPLPSGDLTRRLAAVRFDAAAGTALAGDAAAVAARTADLLTVGLACDAVGLLERALELSVSYALVREQFGAPIGSFQAIKHRCADMFAALVASRAAVRAAVAALAADQPDATDLVSLAKAYAGEAVALAAESCIQVHGGIGFTWEHVGHLVLRRAKADELLFGDPHTHRERLAAALGV